jgi:metallo-beta-lactamase family protein
VTIRGFSAHAGQDLLVKYALSARAQMKPVILVHGETDAATALHDHLRMNGFDRFVYPDLYASLDI